MVSKISSAYNYNTYSYSKKIQTTNPIAKQMFGESLKNASAQTVKQDSAEYSSVKASYAGGARLIADYRKT